LPAQFFSLFFDAQANRGEITGLAISTPKSLIKVLLFMATPQAESILATANFLFLGFEKRGNCTPITYPFSARRSGWSGLAKVVFDD
jgi:hypothetical protein